VLVSSRKQDGHLKGVVKRGGRLHVPAHALRRLSTVLRDAAAQVAGNADVNAARGAVPDAVDTQGFFTPPRAARSLPFFGAAWGAGRLVDGTLAMSSSSTGESLSSCKSMAAAGVRRAAEEG
jgi:hypothetical protein